MATTQSIIEYHEQQAATYLRIAQHHEATVKDLRAKVAAEAEAQEMAPKTIFYHGNKKHICHAYPKGRRLLNKWDTHLTPDEFCCHHGEVNILKSGLGKFQCLGHSSSLDAFDNARAEWMREDYKDGDGVINESRE